ncbi:MAG: EF-hand domain-containing protein [Vicinamibacterales bacterium]
MAINIGSSGDISQVSARLMDRVDSNKDGQLSKDEFNSFLTSLLGGLASASPTTPTLAAVTTAPLRTVAARTMLESRGTYDPIPGFDLNKLNNPEHTTIKYQFGRAVQDLALAPTSANLQAIVDHFNANGGNATITGEDKIDFGDGFGPIDVIFSVGDPEARWQWLPTT